MFWGLTPCLDLLSELNLSSLQEVNILIIGSTDARHVLKTLARRYQKPPVKLNFYIMDLVPEVLAKQLLLLYVALQPVEELGLVQKTRTFMDFFGNSLMRPVSAKHLHNYAQHLVKMITDLAFLKEIMPFINIDLTYKERDYMENVFKFWRCADDFDISECWDRRLRKSLGMRYDTRNGVFDWDLHMRLYNIGGKPICVQEYQSFRRNGVAFNWLESEVSKANRTFVTGVIANGGNFGHYGYLGEMQTGPFIAYGLSCDDEEFLKKSNNQNKYRSTDITERNLREIFHEIEFQSEYEHHKTTEITLGSSVLQLSNLKVVDNSNVESTKQKVATECLKLEGVDINFVQIKSLDMMPHKQKFKDFFHIIYFANPFLKYADTKLLEHISAPKCVLIFEHQLFWLGHRDKDLEEYYKNVQEKTQGLNKFDCDFNAAKDPYIKYVLK